MIQIEQIGDSSVSAKEADLNGQGFATYRLEVCSCDTQEFFRNSLHLLPMGDASLFPDEKNAVPTNWAAFRDWLYQGLSDMGKPTAVFWVDCYKFAEKCPELYLVLLGEIVESVTASGDDIPIMMLFMVDQ